MDKKKILILCFAFFVLLVGLFVAVKSINEKNKKTSSPQKTIAEKKEVNVSSKQDAAVSIMGSIGAIDEKTLSIRQMREVVSVNINSSIVVSNVDLDGKKLGAAKLSDLKTGDSVRVTY